MDSLNLLMEGFRITFTPGTLFAAFLGCLVGTAIGVLPGLGPAATLALLLPIIYGKDPVTMLVMLCAIYYGAQYGGSTTSILMNVPGESSSVLTCLDGYQLAKQGRAAPALGMAAIASFIAGLLSVIVMVFATPILANMGIKFGPAELFALMLFALVACGLLGGDMVKGMAMMFFGLLLSSVGTDPQSGRDRLTFGSLELLSGLEIVPVLMGLFAISEVLLTYEEISIIKVVPSTKMKFSSLFPNRDDWVVSKFAVLRGTLAGFFIGVLPGIGTVAGSFLAYGLERRVSKTPERFGHGAMEGVATVEAANNAAAEGALVPMLALGIPGSASAAILLAAITVTGVQPGPLMMVERPDVFWGVIASMFTGNTILLLLNLPLVGVWASFLRIPYTFMAPCIIIIAMIGTYTISESLADLWLLIILGVLGYILKKNDFPLAPIVIAFILGRSLELNMRRALTMSQGSYTIFIESPIAATFLAISLAMLLWPLVKMIRKPKSTT